MTYDREFLRDFEEWVLTQVKVNETALAASKKLWEEDGDKRAKEASFRYEAKLDTYNFLLNKFSNYHDRKDFHDMPDGLLGERRY